MLISEIMTQTPMTGTLKTTVFDALRALEQEEIRHLPIVEDGALRGIVSDRDLARFTSAAVHHEPEMARQRLRMPVSEIMTADPLTVEADDDVDDAIDLMVENRIGAVPVVDGTDGRLVGIVSYVDILRVARGQLR